MWDEDDDNETVPTDEVEGIGTDRRVDKQFIIEKGLHCLLLPLILWHSVFRLSDGAGNSLIKIISAFLHILASLLNSNTLKGIASKFPLTMKSLLKKIKFNIESMYSIFAVCSSCHAVYPLQYFDDSKTSSYSEVNKCSFVAFPEHPYTSMRKPCNTILMKKETYRKSGKMELKPIKPYVYQSLTYAFGKLLSRQGFLDMCQLWRKRKVPNRFLSDVYDGKFWKTFQLFDGVAFSCSTYNLIVGVIYLVTLNLPRAIRYRIENIILVGIIPGPKEPPLSLKFISGPMVEELQEFWYGKEVNLEKGGSIFIRLAIAFIACDIPALRKVTGFIGHGAHLGCSRCLKYFDTVNGKLSYGGFDRSSWNVRSNEQHRARCQELRLAKTKTQLHELEMKLGVRYSILLDLPYFDPVRFSTIDPMHNLLLGTAKYLLRNFPYAYMSLALDRGRFPERTSGGR